MKKILIVEDDPITKKLMVDAFKKGGFEVAEASNGQEGLETASNFRPDLILTDIMMPIMNGLTMLKELQDREWAKNISVIIYTNSKDSEIIADALKYKTLKYIIKCDMTVDDIVKRVAKELE